MYPFIQSARGTPITAVVKPFLLKPNHVDGSGRRAADEEIIGYACAINGEILFIDIFCDTRLMAQYKYRLLKSYVLEAINRGDKSTGIKVDTQDLADFIAQGNKGEITKSESSSGIGYHIQVTGGVLRTNVKLGDSVVRRAYYKIER